MKEITRNGKIARLPQKLREEANHRLSNGEAGGRLLKWLNELPEVQAVVAAEFGGKPVSKQNLSDWRLGGYQEWLEQQEVLKVAGRISVNGEELREAVKGPLSDQMAVWLLARYLVAVKKLEGQEGEEPAWKRLREFCKDLVALRRGDHYAERLKLEQMKWDNDMKRKEAKALEFCLEEAKKWPKADESFRSAFRLLREYKKKQFDSVAY
jgi:hypothetical protein